MAKVDDDELTQEQALERANGALEQGPLAQMGIKLQSPDEIRVRMMTQLVEATTVDDILGGGAPDSWGDHENRSVIIRDVTYSPSTKKGGLGFYAVVSAIDADTGEPLLLTSGSENVVLQLAKLVQVRGLETPVKLASNKTADGNTVHRLVRGEAGDLPPM